LTFLSGESKLPSFRSSDGLPFFGRNGKSAARLKELTLFFGDRIVSLPFPPHGGLVACAHYVPLSLRGVRTLSSPFSFERMRHFSRNRRLTEYFFSWLCALPAERKVFLRSQNRFFKWCKAEVILVFISLSGETSSSHSLFLQRGDCLFELEWELRFVFPFRANQGLFVLEGGPNSPPPPPPPKNQKTKTTRHPPTKK